MESFERQADNIYRLRVPFPGCWTGIVLVLGPENVLIDSGGCAGTVDDTLLPALAALGITLADIRWLALTHAHGDHVGGAARLRALSPKLRVAAFIHSADRVADPLAYSRSIRERFPSHSPPPPAELTGVLPDLLLPDGGAVGPLRLLHTPGHDTDSCSYWDKRTQTLITGDSLQLNGTVSQGCALLMDVPAYGETLERLMAMPIENIVCGHPYLPLGAGAAGRTAVRLYLSACLKIYAQNGGFVAGMAAAGETDPAAIALALIRQVHGTQPKHLFLPMFTVTGYLAAMTATESGRDTGTLWNTTV